MAVGTPGRRTSLSIGPTHAVKSNAMAAATPVSKMPSASNGRMILFHSVRTASADRVRRMAVPSRHLALVCFLHQAWRDTLDQAVDMYGKLLGPQPQAGRRPPRRHAQGPTPRRRRPGSFTVTAGSARCCSIRTSATTSCGPDCCQPAQLREDQSDLANWTRGDRKARFEQTAERHAGLSQFAAPFLARMKFVDEQGEGASPTLSALRAYREHRAAGRRGVQPDAPLDFAPAALRPLIRRDGRDRSPSLGERLVPQGPRRDPDREPRHRWREELRPVRGVLPRVVCGRGRNPTVRVFTLNVGRHVATGILRSG